MSRKISEYDKCLDMKDYQIKTCKWSENSQIKNPHSFHRNFPKKIYNDVTEAIGNTPIIRINNITKKEGIQCEILAKCEFFNPGGSGKDRIALRMVQELEESGELKKDGTLIEPTSGNTGIGISMVGAVKNYNVVITIPQRMSVEKCDLIKGLGARVFRMPNNAPFDSFQSYYGKAISSNSDIVNSVMPDQYTNKGNSLAHYDGTGQEIWEQCDGKIDYIIIGTGTGGFLTGIGRKLKDKNPDIKIIGVDPQGSILAFPEDLNTEFKGKPYKIEGTGKPFIPKNCDRSIVDKWYKSNDKDSFTWARRIINEEGLLVGGSSGAVFGVAMEIAKTLDKDKRIVVVFVDSVRNYLTKFVNDRWMIDNDFYKETVEVKNEEDNIEKFIQISNLEKTIVCNARDTIKDIYDKMIKTNQNYALVLKKDIDSKEEFNKFGVAGILSKKIILSNLLNLNCQKTDRVEAISQGEYKALKLLDPVEYLKNSFLYHNFVLIKGKTYNDSYILDINCFKE